MKLTYRPEIDGLRAIAVGAVILYHAQITILGHQPFKGGFIGVDIFFVISGYLITSIILKELVTTGSFSFKHFYERRVRRILPALLFVMLVSLPFAWMYLLPSSFVDFSKSILYSLGFSSNFYFHYSGQQYGALGGLFMPFLHTWSLSVEEQFYILFPIVLLITFKYFRNHLLTILVIGLIISLQMADWGSRNYSSANFYFLHTRMWELLAGSILAYFEITLGHRSKNKTLNLILPSIGLFLIVHSILFFNDKIFHPSFYTLSPIIGVCLIIWFSNKNELITKILSTKLFVGIGLISYSLYLWHYPIFAFARILDFVRGNLLHSFLIGIMLFIISTLSYYFVEKPFRNKYNKFKLITCLILFLIFILGIFNFNTIQKNGYSNSLPPVLKKSLEEAPWDLLKNLDGEKCFVKHCRFNTSSNKKVYIIGDSHMASIMFDLKNRLVKDNYQFISMTGCLYFVGFDLINTVTGKLSGKCNNNYFQKLKLILSKEKDSIIIFGGRYKFYNQQDIIREKNYDKFQYVSVGKYDNPQTSFKRELLELSKNNKLIIIYPIPEAETGVQSKFFNKMPKRINLMKDFLKPENFISTSYEVYLNKSKNDFEILNNIQHQNVYRVYPHKLFCNTIIVNRCLTHDDKDLFYFDDHHPSIKGAKMINDLIIKEIKKIELKFN